MMAACFVLKHEMDQSSHFPFSILHLSFVIASGRSSQMTNDKWKMENAFPSRELLTMKIMRMKLCQAR